jgi:hypothetical protein
MCRKVKMSLNCNSVLDKTVMRYSRECLIERSVFSSSLELGLENGIGGFWGERF